MRNAVAHGMRRVARAEASLPPAPNPRTLDLAIASLHLVRSRPSDESCRQIVPIWTFFVASYRPYRVIPLPDRAIVLPLSESPPRHRSCCRAVEARMWGGPEVNDGRLSSIFGTEPATTPGGELGLAEGDVSG